MSRAARRRVLVDVERQIELRLVARLKAGDPAAFEAIYEAYRPRLFGFLVRLSRRRDLAEDLLEETWLRLVTRAETLGDDTPLAPWLFAVARNLYLSWRRSRGVDAARTSELDPAWPAPERGELAASPPRRPPSSSGGSRRRSRGCRSRTASCSCSSAWKGSRLRRPRRRAACPR